MFDLLTINNDMLALIKDIKKRYKIKHTIELFYTDETQNVGATIYKPAKRRPKIFIGISHKSLLKHGQEEVFRLLRHELAHAICMARNQNSGHDSTDFKRYCYELKASPYEFIGRSV